MIKPLGEQIIIRTLKPDSIGSIIIPDSAKAITKTGESSLTNQLNFVEAEVIAVGPGKRMHDDKTLISDLAYGLQQAMAGMIHSKSVERLLDRAERSYVRMPMIVKPGDRILFHPSVQKFDRQIEPEWIGLKSGEGDCFIIREESVLAILDSEEEGSATQTDSAVA